MKTVERCRSSWFEHMVKSRTTERLAKLVSLRSQLMRKVVSQLHTGHERLMRVSRIGSSLTLTKPVACVIAIIGAASPQEMAAQYLTTYAAGGPVYSWSSHPSGHSSDHAFGFAAELGGWWQAARDVSIRTGAMYAHFFDSQSDDYVAPCFPGMDCPSPVGAVNMGAVALSVMLHARQEGQPGSIHLFVGPGAYVTDSRRVDAHVLFGWHGGVGIERRQTGRGLVFETRIQQIMQVDSDGDDWPMVLLMAGIRL